MRTKNLNGCLGWPSWMVILVIWMDGHLGWSSRLSSLTISAGPSRLVHLGWPLGVHISVGHPDWSSWLFRLTILIVLVGHLGWSLWLAFSADHLDEPSDWSSQLAISVDHLRWPSKLTVSRLIILTGHPANPAMLGKKLGEIENKANIKSELK